MRTFSLAAAALACALQGDAAWSSQWFSLDTRAPRTAATLVEVDLSTVRVGGGAGEAVIRISHEAAQPHPVGYAYRSVVATAQFDCQRQVVTLVSAAYFERPGAEGARLGADSTGREAGMPARVQDSIPAHARQALLRAACAS